MSMRECGVRLGSAEFGRNKSVELGVTDPVELFCIFFEMRLWGW